ncbi:MAG TPA: hypothetical protein VFX12_16040 [Vicinamibacterales bacterium]|nr:hypothetical protein [Vicinamibacterales bacterium]
MLDVRGLTKRHGGCLAVDRVDFQVPVGAAIPLFWVALGLTAPVAVIVVALVALVFVHAVLLGWRRIPFTCSYLPGKRFAGQTFLVDLAAFLLFTMAGQALVRAATASTSQAAIIVVALFLAGHLLRRRRVAGWRRAPLVFEDEFPDAPVQLRL